MQTLLALLVKHKFFLLFVVLELIAFTMIINNTYYQRYILVNNANKVTGTVYQWKAGVSEYFFLKKVNTSLALENARLHEKIERYQSGSEETHIYPQDTLTENKFEFIPAKVISNSTNKRNNYLMINKGWQHGIKPDMAVISSDGVVGIVINTSDNYSWVMSVLNSNTKINGRFLNTNFQGSLSWDGKDYRIGTFSDVPSHVVITAGDTIVTSGYSFIFPPDIMIGTVRDYYIGKGDHFYTAKLLFSVDYNNISHVYVVRNNERDELLSIITDVSI